ncbi:MAG: ABC transporter substrate-binding protein [Firmicutes bacterium]|nr:ABC transporter substrate-binding protein [Bacillota bacterium]
MREKRFFFPILTAALLICALLSGCGASEGISRPAESPIPISSMKLDFAENFSVDYYEGGFKLISINDGSRYLVIPEGREAPEALAEGAVPLRQPVNDIYMANSAAMCLFDALERLDTVRFSGTKAQGWYVENARLAMEKGDIVFAGKYSEPDYELLVGGGCPLAVENTMINRSSEVRDKLTELGIAVITDQSSLEPHPLGRTEWIRLYAALLDEEDKAEEVMKEQKALLSEAQSAGKSGKTAAFFYISSAGRVVARRSGDYIPKMIALAGGEYAFDDPQDTDLKNSSLTLEMESFFDMAKDADVIIYNGAMDAEPGDLADLLSKSPVLDGFRAVKEGNVWSTGRDFYQLSTDLGQMIRSMSMIFGGEADGLDEVPFLRRLK